MLYLHFYIDFSVCCCYIPFCIKNIMIINGEWTVIYHDFNIGKVYYRIVIDDVIFSVVGKVVK